VHVDRLVFHFPLHPLLRFVLAQTHKLLLRPILT
jgi:hypothetical protein